jgi:TPR repeat protein
MDTAIDLRTSRDTVVDRNMMRLEWIGKPLEARVSKPPEARGNKPPEVRAKEQRAEPQEAVRAAPVVQQFDPDELAVMLKRGLDYLQIGDIAAARIVLRRAANAGHAPAALALGASFDPYVFGELGVLGFAADPAQARAWYERAGQLGASEAPRRIERLARLGP